MKRKNRLDNEGFKYIFFGVLTTLINIVMYGILSFLDVQYIINTIISFLVSITFAYITNKLYVFNSNNWEKAILVQEILKFMTSRLGMFIIEIGVMLTLVEFFTINDFISKGIVNIIVIIGNYMLSKFVVFKV